MDQRRSGHLPEDIPFGRLLAWTIQKEIRLQWGGGVWGTLGLLVLVLALLMMFAVGPGRAGTESLVPAGLWVTAVLVLIWQLEVEVVQEEEERAGEALWLAAADPLPLLVGRTLVLAVEQLAVVLVTFVLLWAGMRAGGGTVSWGAFTAVLALGSLGLALVGGLAADLLRAAEFRFALLPLVIVPLSLPLVLTAVPLTVGALGSAGEATGIGWRFLVVYDGVAAGMAWLLREWLDQG
ncbi:MAG: heme exporter protein CcmB [Limnochordaceae bacterium]|nr:heme exporter protein CcmB [Limnochordaceae bacterium]